MINLARTKWNHGNESTTDQIKPLMINNAHSSINIFDKMTLDLKSKVEKNKEWKMNMHIDWYIYWE